jgi:hypothetical protein
MLSLWGTQYALGIQANTLYFRTDNQFCWFRGGVHSDAQSNAGGGVLVMALNAANDLSVFGNAFKPGGGAWAVLSDIRLKHHVAPLTGALDRLLALRGVTFEWREPARHGNLHGRQIGLVAQEVEAVFPEWVGVDAEGYKHVTVRGLEALTVEALRELTIQIDDIRRRLDGIETMVSRPV